MEQSSRKRALFSLARFIFLEIMANKYIQQRRDSKELNELLKHEHNCFILLTQIAQRAKRTKDFSSEGLDINQALIGDYKTIGLTEQKYRTAKNKLKKWQFVTFKTTNKGTIATLLNTSIYNINAENNNEQDNSQVTNEQRTGNEQVTTNKNVKKEKNDNNLNIYIEKWNKFLEPKVSSLTKDRKIKLRVRLNEKGFIDNYDKLLVIIKDTPFLRGDNEKGWSADFDWIIKNDTNYVKILEGKYKKLISKPQEPKKPVPAYMKEI